MNRLAEATSPYLLQHADNPVDWYPWGDEALSRAGAEDRPIFLSIGYAACHWCHVMEHESFEDEDTASFLNEHFVAIKVDREERPDLDAIYMDAVQAMTGQGGWPLSAFLTPSGEPFFAGTYFPKVPSHGMPSFRQVLEGIAEAWRERRADVLEQGGRVVEAISRTALLQASGDPLTEEVETEALASLGAAFDATWGGFGGAPKFPQPMTLEFLLRIAARGSSEARTMATTTLDRMAAGGIYDQLGGGFARYATDATWLVPHFEKMLYDNAQLAQVYARAWQLTRDDRHRRVANETLRYLLREMRQTEGGFSSSQDADSEGVEGRFFTWPWDEVVALAGDEAARALGASPGGNWEGTNVLTRPDDAAFDGVDLDVARQTLFAERERRVRPATDDKVLTAWNGMTIHALAVAGRAFDEPDFTAAAIETADFVLANLRDENGRLLRSWRRGVRGGPGYADDHALLASGLLALYERTGDLRWFEEARRLAGELVRLFLDRERGGFFQTGSDVDPLVIRPKELYDNAVPSGNSAAADVLLRLSLLTGDGELEGIATDAIALVRDVLGRAPTGFGHALCALDLLVGPSNEIAIVGAPDDPSTRALADEVLVRRFLPNAVLASAAPGDERAAASVALLRDRPQRDGVATAFVCRRFACRLPVTTPQELAGQLSETAG